MSRRVLRLLLGSLAALLLAGLFIAPHDDRRAVPGHGWLTGPLDAGWLPGPLGPGSVAGPTDRARITEAVGAGRSTPPLHAIVGTDESSHGRHEQPAITNPSAPAPDQHLATGPAAASPAPRQPKTKARAAHAQAPAARLPRSIAPRAPPALLDR